MHGLTVLIVLALAAAGCWITAALLARAYERRRLRGSHSSQFLNWHRQHPVALRGFR
jgi:hypothetical protein